MIHVTRKERQVTVVLQDAYPDEPGAKEVKAVLRINRRGIAINFEGFGDKTSQPNRGEPVFVEIRQGVPHVLVWGSVNQEDPTHTVSLYRAAESYRQPEAAP